MSQTPAVILPYHLSLTSVRQRFAYTDEDKNEVEVAMEGSENGRSEINDQINNILHEVHFNILNLNVETLDEEERNIIDQLQEIDYKRLNKLLESVSKAIVLIETTTITQTNNLIKAASMWVADQTGLKPQVSKNTTS